MFSSSFLRAAASAIALSGFLLSSVEAADPLSINPYKDIDQTEGLDASICAGSTGACEQVQDFSIVSSTVCFHHVPDGTSTASTSIRCGGVEWPANPPCSDSRLREHGVPTLVDALYFARPHQIVTHLAFSAECDTTSVSASIASSGGGAGSLDGGDRGDADRDGVNDTVDSDGGAGTN